MTKTRNFIAKIYEKPQIYKIKATNKKEAKQFAIFKYIHEIEKYTSDIHEIKVVSDTDAEFYSVPLTKAIQEQEL